MDSGEGDVECTDEATSDAGNIDCGGGGSDCDAADDAVVGADAAVGAGDSFHGQ